MLLNYDSVLIFLFCLYKCAAAFHAAADVKGALQHCIPRSTSRQQFLVRLCVSNHSAKRTAKHKLPYSIDPPQNIRKLELDCDTVSKLQQQLQSQQHKNGNEKDSNDMVQIEGYITSQRNFGSSFCFVDLSRRNISVPVQAMLKRQAFGNATRFDGCMKSLVPGIQVCITGPVAPTRNPGEALVLIKEMTIQKLPRNPQHVRKLLKLVSDGFLGVTDLSSAAKMSPAELLRAIKDEKEKFSNPNHPKLFSGLAKVIVALLEEENQSETDYPLLPTDNKECTRHLPVAPADVQHPPQPQRDKPKDYILNPQISSPSSVQSILDDSSSDGELTESFETINVVGWVQNRRRFSGSITVLEMVDHMVPTGTWTNPLNDGGNLQEEDSHKSFWKQRLKCTIHPEMIDSNNCTTAHIYGQLLAPGTKVRLEGFVVRNKYDSFNKLTVAWITRIYLLQSSWRPSVIRVLIEQVVKQKFDATEAAHALKISQQEVEEIVRMNDMTKWQWKSAEISTRLQRQSMDLSSYVDPKALEVLDDFNHVREAYPIQYVDIEMPTYDKTDFISTEGSRWKSKKEPQLEWMAQQIEELIGGGQADHFSGITNQRPLQILDVGGGKGFLANYLATRLKERGYMVRILVLDVAEGAIRNGRQRTQRQNLSDVVEYEVADASTTKLNLPNGLDLVIALHACGTLTDVALAHAVNHKASFAICPCCFCSNPHLTIPMEDTDDRGQKSMTLEKWLHIDPECLQLVKNLAEIQGDIRLANRAIHTICSLRSAAVERHKGSIFADIAIKMFPVAFSTRNFCLVGRIDQ